MASAIPDTKNEAPTIDAAVLMEIFEDVKSTTDRLEQCFAYCLALLLVRLKKLRYVELREEDDQWWLYLSRKGGIALRVRDPKMSTSEEAYVQETIQELITPQAATQKKKFKLHQVNTLNGSLVLILLSWDRLIT